MRGPREGLAYATITLPGQVTAIRAVLHEVQTRLPSAWSAGVKNVLDFGSQTGAGFWYVFYALATLELTGLSGLP
jgi:ribosomal protein RSM22 (predicted rRNA methylase)